MQTRLVHKIPHMRRSDYPQCSSECLVIYKYAQQMIFDSGFDSTGRL